MNPLSTTSVVLLGVIGCVVACTSWGGDVYDRPAEIAVHEEQRQSDDSSEQLDVDVAVYFSYASSEYSPAPLVEELKFWTPRLDAFRAYTHPDGKEVTATADEASHPVSTGGTRIALPSPAFAEFVIASADELPSLLEHHHFQQFYYAPPQPDEGRLTHWQFRGWLSDCDAFFTAGGSGGKPDFYDATVINLCDDATVFLGYGLAEEQLQRTLDDPCGDDVFDCDGVHTETCRPTRMECPSRQIDVRTFEIAAFRSRKVDVITENSDQVRTYRLPFSTDSVDDADRLTIRQSNTGLVLTLIAEAGSGQ